MPLSRGKNVAQHTMETTTVESRIKQTVDLGNFGNGRYSPVMSELYQDTQRLLGFSKEQAHVTSARLGIDLGRLTSGQVRPEDIRLGAKTNKDGMRTVREVCSLKMPNSWALSIAVICNGLDNLRKQGLEVVECSVKDTLLEFVNDAAVKLNK
jgi:hypothetical protein